MNSFVGILLTYSMTCKLAVADVGISRKLEEEVDAIGYDLKADNAAFASIHFSGMG